MYVKVYEYHIPTDKIKEYFYIQEKASNIYRKYINSTTTYLQSNDDPTKWLEITTYQTEQDYDANIALINEQTEIVVLFQEFQALLPLENSQIKEENFTKTTEIK
ncbi:hypothetical protein C2I06_08830 [Niallia circulans]|uniref:Uncharacterized protein n=1 Tax=Niallia circulans TaxID=1397 RepID=A0A268F5U0_NIACI|nr:hypothetical protein [Niallia circulans]AYV66967.1 hypothetical protein C2I06_08830 [Niallia circulans]AYV70171.1 hypothetical protein C2H98_00520 [Niallia circulans]NRG28608.1 hypothetical protein [Niallia circulans]PAD80730.1 hypothetical protein CHH57_23585 [Niallia circulans]QJX62858.1 hypothetical protein HLK66_15165 [Niallia circulans]